MSNMNFAGRIKGLAVGLAALGLCLPQPLLAAVQANQSPVVTDVTLHQSPQGNVLLGRVQDPQGAVHANVLVTLYGNGNRLAETKTDRNGYFSFGNLRGGVYQLIAAGGGGAYRAWTPGTAPPSAQRGALVVGGSDVVRGQFHPVGHTCGGMKFWLCHPFVIGGILAVAVGAPLLLLDDEPKSK